jgi:hypothetical protein
MKMKKMIFLMLVFFMGITASMNAQVNIGSEDGPKAGAVLDLSQGTKHLGLILPNVSLANVSEWQLDEGAGKTSTSYLEAAGTVIFNTNAGLTDALGNTILGQGIFVWNGNGWQAAKGGTGEVLAQDFILTANGSPVSDGSAINLWTGESKSFAVDAGSFLPASDEVVKGVKWVIAPASIAAIQDGSTYAACTVDGVTEGTATLTVTSLDNNVTKTVTINVQPVGLSDFDLNPAGLNLTLGGAFGTVTASNFKGEDGEDFTGATITWTPTGSTGGNLVEETATTYKVTPNGSAAEWTVMASAGGIEKGPFTVSVTCPPVTQPGTITITPNPVTAGETFTASITAVANATGYVWNTPAGLTISAGQGTTSVTYTTSTATTIAAGAITVYATNDCGNQSPSKASTTAVTVNPVCPTLSQPGTITITPTTVTAGGTFTASITAVTNADSYVWNIPSGKGLTITNGQGTTSVTYTTSTATTIDAGAITVYATNTCGNSSPSKASTTAVTVNAATPTMPGTITASGTAISNSATGIILSVTAVANATSYTWTLPTGWNITAGENTRSITVSTSDIAAFGTVSVAANNAAGQSSPRNLTAYINHLPTKGTDGKLYSMNATLTTISATPSCPTGYADVKDTEAVLALINAASFRAGHQSTVFWHRPYEDYDGSYKVHSAVSGTWSLSASNTSKSLCVQ